MLEELQQDRSDLSDVIAEQDLLDGLYDDLERWLADPASAPPDSMYRGLDSLAYSNRTMYPRRSGWTTMVAGDQLGFLYAPDLPTRLGDLFENANVRLSENGSGHDLHLYADRGRRDVPRPVEDAVHHEEPRPRRAPRGHGRAVRHEPGRPG